MLLTTPRLGKQYANAEHLLASRASGSLVLSQWCPCDQPPGKSSGAESSAGFPGHTYGCSVCWEECAECEHSGEGSLKGACAWTPPASACASVLYEPAGSASSSSEGGGGLGNPQHTGSDKASSLELPHGVVHVA